jgi:hypothetical protein
MANPVTYNSGSNPTGALKFGTMSMSVAPSLNITGYNWRNGFDSNNMWTIYSDTFSQGQSTQGNSLPTIWSTPQFTEQGLIDMINVLPARAGQTKFTTLSSAISWLVGEGKYFISNQNYPQMITDGLQFFVDAGLTASYPQVGSSWYELSGSLTGAINNSPVWVNQKTKSHFVFDSTDEWVNFPNNTNLNSNSITVSSWFNPDAVSQNGFLFEKGYVNTQYALFFEGTTFKLRFMFTNLGMSDLLVTGSDYMTAGRWYNATVTYDGSTARMYINGVNVLTTTYNDTIQVNNNGERIGSWYNGVGTGYHFDGKIAKTLVYNKALSASETLVNYYQGNIITSGLVLHFDAANIVSYPGSGTNVYNLVANSSNGTLNNSPTFSSDSGGCFVFDGTDDYISFANPLNQAQLSQVWTVQAWIYIQSKPPQLLVSGLGAGLYIEYVQGDNSLLYLNSGTNDYYTYGGQFTNQGWVLATFRFNNANGDRQIWRNTTIIGNANGPNNTSTPLAQGGTFNIGTAGSDTILGKVANIMIYNRYITDSEIQQNYAAYQDRFKSYFPYANGGTVSTVSIDGINYRVHTFTTSGTLTVVKGGFVEVLVVAGGGSAGAALYHSGGGGAGGLIYRGDYQIENNSTITVTVGAGGVAPTTEGSRGNNGNNSVFGTLTAIGGGGGGTYQNATGLNGGSGGGGGAENGVFGAGGQGTAGQGFDGGDYNGDAGSSKNSGGGGGAAQVGQDGRGFSSGGNGGNGIQYSINGTNTYYAGGGGGSTEVVGITTTGGLGGGGNGNWNTGQNGTANTGGGGGAGERISPATTGAGGSGIVIVRYPIY